jgi:hypothetical protein
LRQAEELVSTMERLFWDEEDGGFFLTDGSERLIAQPKSPYDGAVASGNSEAAHVLVSLATATGRDAYRQRARQTLQAFAGVMGGGSTRMLLALHLYLNPDSVGSAPQAGPPAEPAVAVAPGLMDILSGLSPTAGEGGALSTDSGDFVRAEPFVSVDRLVPGRSFEVAARLVVAPGWHINANPASYDFLIPTTLQVTSDLPVEVVSIDYPPAGVSSRPSPTTHCPLHRPDCRPGDPSFERRRRPRGPRSPCVGVALPSL